MAALDIACPKCGRLLRLPDDTLLGRLGQCAKCGHKFRLHEPLELPAAGNAARGSARKKMSASEAVAEQPAPIDEFAALQSAVAESETPVVNRMRRRAQPGRAQQVLSVVSIFVVSGVVVWGLWLTTFTRGPGSAAVQDAAGEIVDNDSEDPAAKAPVAGQPSTGEPSRGEPISLQYVPQGARLVVHVRPAELWGLEPRFVEFRGCLGPLADWGAEQLRATTLLPAEEISEALFSLIPISREAFSTAVVVRSREPLRTSQLIERFGGQLVDQPRVHYVNADRACLFADAHTLAIVPRELAPALLDRADAAPIAADGLRELLKYTDRTRHLTALCEVEDLRLGEKSLAPAAAQNALDALLDFLGDDSETFCFSFRLGDPARHTGFSSEMLVRHGTSIKTKKFLEGLRKKSAAVPRALLDFVYRTQPRTLGEKKLVGRLPAMTKVVERLLEFEPGRRLVTLAVDLPERAGPNLALAGRLAWQQTVVGNLPNGPATPTAHPASPSAHATTIAARLKKNIDVDFRNEFLAAAVAFVGEETGVTFELDGPGMKLVGVTQNERQNFALAGAPATAVLDRILSPRNLVLIVDERLQKAIVTSQQAAETKNLTTFPLADR